MSPSVVIIGGGVMGCAVALRLAERGMAPLVLERSVPGAEASSAAAGILAPQEESKGPGPLLDLGLESRARWPAFVRELESATGVDIGYRRSGLIAMAGEGGVRELESRAAWQSARGLRVERLTPAEVKKIEPALGECSLALRFPDEAQVEPRRLVRAVQLAAAKAGAEFQTAYVRRILCDERDDRVRGVEVEGGIIETPRVIVAAGSWSGLIDGARLPPGAVRPLRGQLVELETRPPLFSHIVFSSSGYLVPRADGRVIVGSTMEEVGFKKDVTVSGLSSLLELARRAVPALEGASVRGFWSNFRPATSDHLPILGRTSIHGLFLATGHFRNGILLTPVTADALAAAVCDEPPPINLAPFALDRFTPSPSS